MSVRYRAIAAAYSRKLRQGVRYQQEVITVRLHQWWHRMASISPRLAGKAPQERF